VSCQPSAISRQENAFRSSGRENLLAKMRHFKRYAAPEYVHRNWIHLAGFPERLRAAAEG